MIQAMNYEFLLLAYRQIWVKLVESVLSYAAVTQKERLSELPESSLQNRRKYTIGFLPMDSSLVPVSVP